MISLKVFLATLLYVPWVQGHGYLSNPKTINHASDVTAFAGTIDGPSAIPGSNYNWSPGDNTRDFTKNFAQSPYKTLRDLIRAKANTGACGNTVLGDPQPLPDQIEWAHSQNEGFTPSHEGPCEAWCDDKRVFQNDNCAKNYPQAPARLPYDKASCAGAKTFTFYWLALHTPQWQVYIACAAISGGGGPASYPSSTPAPAPGTSPYPAPGTTPVVVPNQAPQPPPGSPSSPTPGPWSAPGSSPGNAPQAPPHNDDCLDDLAIAGDDCGDNLPIAGDDCGDNLPVAGDDCVDLPEPNDYSAGKVRAYGE